MPFGRKAKLRRLLRQGDAARDASRWQDAAAAYRRALAIDPANAPIHVQFGHAAKEAGDRAGAERAYRAATAARPDQTDGWVQLGALLRHDGRVAEAVEAYARALGADPACADARSALIQLGARNAIPDAARYSPAERGEFDRLAAAMRELAGRADAIAQATIHPTRTFDAFRGEFPVQPPPAVASERAGGTILVRIDARGAMPVQVRETLASLADQSHRDWRAIVMGSPELAAHPVAGAAVHDPRIGFMIAGGLAPTAEPTVLIRAGTALDPQALAWFAFVADRTGCAAAYSDHDHAVDEWHAPRRHADPVFQPAFDPDWFGGGLSPPAAIYLAAGPGPAERDDFGALLVEQAAGGRPVAHIPRLLATMLALPEEARRAPPDAIVGHSPIAIPRIAAAPRASRERIAVIIPTRDQAELLERCVATLVERRGSAPIEILIVDNRSTQSATKDLLERWKRAARARVLVMDEPFSWSRANNLAAAATDAPHLLFLNNDTEMLADRWADRLNGWLARDDVGIVGARLLYPDDSVQHAGFVFGMNGPPAHEAVGVAADAAGPEGRWLRPRSVPAVTGAFMAMRRSVWEHAGGFEERDLPIGFSDVDMCLRVRAAGLRVIYAPELQLIHHESKTRGLNVTRSQVAWDRAELRALHRRWRRSLFDDPGLNPHWARHGQLFDGYREPPLGEILRHIDLGARAALWVPDASD